MALKYPRTFVSIFLPQTSRFFLDGAPIVIHQSHVTIRSEGEGAIIDAEGLSRHFDVAFGARLHLENLRLVNGGFEMSGGSVLVRNGGRFTADRLHIADSVALATSTAVRLAPSNTQPETIDSWARAELFSPALCRRTAVLSPSTTGTISVRCWRQQMLVTFIQWRFLPTSQQLQVVLLPEASACGVRQDTAATLPVCSAPPRAKLQSPCCC